MEPPAKRPRLSISGHHQLYRPANSTGGGSSGDGDDDDDELNFEPEEVSERRDPGYQLVKSREFAAHKLKSTFEHIFEKYERDFTGVGDEIDLRTGEVVVDNGHLQHMRNEKDVGCVEDEGMLLEEAFASEEDSRSEGGYEDDEEEEEDRILQGRPPQSLRHSKSQPQLQLEHSGDSTSLVPARRAAQLPTPARLASEHRLTALASGPGSLSRGWEPPNQDLVEPAWRVPDLPRPKYLDSLTARLFGAPRYEVPAGSRSIWSGSSSDGPLTWPKSSPSHSRRPFGSIMAPRPRPQQQLLELNGSGAGDEDEDEILMGGTTEMAAVEDAPLSNGMPKAPGPLIATKKTGPPITQPNSPKARRRKRGRPVRRRSSASSHSSETSEASKASAGMLQNLVNQTLYIELPFKAIAMEEYAEVPGSPPATRPTSPHHARDSLPTPPPRESDATKGSASQGRKPMAKRIEIRNEIDPSYDFSDGDDDGIPIRKPESHVLPASGVPASKEPLHQPSSDLQSESTRSTRLQARAAKTHVPESPPSDTTTTEADETTTPTGQTLAHINLERDESVPAPKSPSPRNLRSRPRRPRPPKPDVDVDDFVTDALSTGNVWEACGFDRPSPEIPESPNSHADGSSSPVPHLRRTRHQGIRKFRKNSPSRVPLISSRPTSPEGGEDSESQEQAPLPDSAPNLRLAEMLKLSAAQEVAIQDSDAFDRISSPILDSDARREEQEPPALEKSVAADRPRRSGRLDHASLAFRPPPRQSNHSQINEPNSHVEVTHTQETHTSPAKDINSPKRNTPRPSKKMIPSSPQEPAAAPQPSTTITPTSKPASKPASPSKKQTPTSSKPKSTLKKRLLSLRPPFENEDSDQDEISLVLLSSPASSRFLPPHSISSLRGENSTSSSPRTPQVLLSSASKRAKARASTSAKYGSAGLGSLRFRVARDGFGGLSTPTRKRKWTDVGGDSESEGAAAGGSLVGSPVRTPGGHLRRCGVGGFSCGRDFCFTCLAG